MKNLICCFTGHRKIPLNKYDIIQKRLENEIIKLIDQGVCCFLAGGAWGFDTMAALAVLRLQSKFPHIRLMLVLPCKEQTRRWGRIDKMLYDVILHYADKVIYTSEHYYPGCMHKRNRYLVNNSQICICYLTKANGGTACTINYARQEGSQIINIALNKKSHSCLK